MQRHEKKIREFIRNNNVSLHSWSVNSQMYLCSHTQTVGKFNHRKRLCLLSLFFSGQDPWSLEMAIQVTLLDLYFQLPSGFVLEDMVRTCKMLRFVNLFLALFLEERGKKKALFGWKLKRFLLSLHQVLGEWWFSKTLSNSLYLHLLPLLPPNQNWF